MSTGEMIIQGLEKMGIGIGVVFAVILLFYGVIKLMMKIWPAK
jgi:Na+-transporting methylmalonyl-CoA/oxaloacetate decarboxylase gamma subunit